MSDLTPQVGDKVKDIGKRGLGIGVVVPSASDCIRVCFLYTDPLGFAPDYDGLQVVERATYEPVPEPFEPWMVVASNDGFRSLTRYSDGNWRGDAFSEAKDDSWARELLASGHYRIVARPVKDGAE